MHISDGELIATIRGTAQANAIVDQANTIIRGEAAKVRRLQQEVRDLHAQLAAMTEDRDTQRACKLFAEGQLARVRRH